MSRPGVRCGVRRYIQMSNAVLGIFVSVEVKGNIERVRVRLGVEGLEMDELIAIARHSEFEGERKRLGYLCLSRRGGCKVGIAIC